MSTANLTLYNLEATLMRLMFEREELAAEGLSIIEKDIEIREYVGREIKKVDGVAYYLKEFEARAAAAKEEAKRLKARADAWEARHERLKTLVKSVMLMSGKARLDGDSNTLRLVKCPASVEIAQPELVPAEYCASELKLTVADVITLKAACRESKDPEAQRLGESLPFSNPKREPMKIRIAEALKQQIACAACHGIGRTTPFSDAPGCPKCNATGKVNQGVPGCSLVTDKMSLRVE
jgi:hypothetical protein